MDFSKKEVINKQKSIKSTSKRLTSKLWVTAFRLAIVALVSVIIIGVMAGWGILNAIVDTAPDISQIDVAPTGFSSASYYSDGTLAQTFAGAEANRVYVTIDEIPKIVQDCFIALEDERFYEHKGIDVRGIFRAGYSVLKTGDLFGASTITQQLLKNQVFSGGDEDNIIDRVTRKIQEQYLAIQLESRLSKELILEYYLNYVNLGSGAYGIQTAAKTYFGKNVWELTLSEAAVIAPIPHSPTYHNPITYPDSNAERREACLTNMLELGLCTKEQYDEAINDDVYSRIQLRSEEQSSTSTAYSYFTDAMLKQLIQDFQTELGYSASQAEQLIYYGGISIFTTQDKEVQKIVDEYYQDESNFPPFGFTSSTGSCYELTYALSVIHPDGTQTHYQRQDFIDYFADFVDSDYLYYHFSGGNRGISELLLDTDDTDAKIEEFRSAMLGEGDTYIERKEYVPQPQSSFSLIEQSTGKVAALYGGRGEKEASLTLNRASGTTRQVGSTFKVLASFLPAIDAGGLTLASVQDDSRYFYPGTEKEVINWYNTGFRGLQSIRTGIYSSLNIVAVKTLEQIGAPLGFEYLEKLGFSTLVRSKTDANGNVFSDINLSIALGGLTNGVSNLELTAAYGAIANGGVYNKPVFYTKVTDHDGKVLLSREPDSTQVMKSSTAWLLTNAMEDTVKRGTGSRLRFREYSMPVAGKTGTASTSKYRSNDLWFVGFTPYYTAAVWTGYDNNFTQRNTSYQQDLWRNIMEKIHSSLELPYQSFEMPDSIISATICTKCGNLAVSGLCDEAEGGSCALVEYFAKGTVPSAKCSCHVKVNVCKKSKKLATEFCPEKRIKTTVYLIKEENYEETTWDTQYILSNQEYCDVHTDSGQDAGDPDEDNDDNNEGDGIPSSSPSPSPSPTPAPDDEIVIPPDTDIPGGDVSPTIQPDEEY